MKRSEILYNVMAEQQTEQVTGLGTSCVLTVTSAPVMFSITPALVMFSSYPGTSHV